MRNVLRSPLTYFVLFFTAAIVLSLCDLAGAPVLRTAHGASASNQFVCQKVAYNPGALTANGTAGAQVSTTVTCPGVALGDMCDGVSSSVDPGAGIIISCNVSAANTVRIQVFNSTSGTPTVPSANYTVLMQPKYISP